jgi:PAS domain S-box-containing protein
MAVFSVAMGDEQIRSRERLFAALVENSPDIISRFDRNLRCLYTSPAAEAATGMPPDFLVGKTHAEMGLPPAMCEAAEAALRRIFESGRRDTVEFTIPSPEGPRYFEAYGVPEIGPDGDVETVLTISRDVTERRLAERDRDRAAQMLESISDAFYGVDTEWRFRYVNAQAERYFGRRRDELLGRVLWEEIPSELGTVFEEHYRAAMRDREAAHFEALSPFSSTWVEVHAYPSPDGLSIHFRDVSARRSAEEALRESQMRLSASEARFQSFMDNSPAAAWITDSDGRVLYLSATYYRMFKLPTDDPIGRSPAELYPEPLARQYLENIRRVAETGEVIEAIEDSVRADGTTGSFFVYKFPLPGAEGLVGGVAVDITERLRAEEALRDSEERLQTLADSVSQLVWMADPDGYIFWYNLRWYEYTGTSPEDMAGWGWRSVHDPEVLPQVVERWSESLRTGTPFEMEFPLRRGDGVYRWFLTRATPLRNERNEVVRWFGTNTDIDDLKRAREELAANEERLRRIVDSEMVGILFWGRDGRVLDANDEFLRMFGYSREDIAKGLNWTDITPPGWDEVDARAMAELVERGKCAPFEKEYRHKDGRAIPVLVGGVMLDARRATGVAYVADITDRKRAEEERTRLLREAQAANRLKDEFLATLSHELRTPLNAIVGWSRLLLTGNLGAEASRNALEAIARNAKAQTQIVEDVLDISRIITGKLRLDLRPTALDAVVGAAVDAIRPAAEAKGVVLATQSDGDTGLVMGDADRLQQVAWNLLSNAVKFTPRDGRVELRVSRVEPHVEITVADTGAGIAPEFMPYVFDRFRQADSSTTREHGGLGLGLAIARQLVELHGGSIMAESPGEGGGATFTVRLPATTAAVEADETAWQAEIVEAAVGDSAPEGHGGTLEGLRVIVVDDDEDARLLVAEMLAERGALPVTAASAAEALAAIEVTPPDVLVSDIGMPGEDGYALITKVRALAPERGGSVPAVALTAYARVEDRVRALASGFQMHVPKPVDPEELAVVVATLAEWRTAR